MKEEAAEFRKVSDDFPDVEILVTGIGKKNAERAIRKSLGASRPGLILTCGFAGALDTELKIGDVIFDAEVGSEVVEILKAAGGKPVKFYCAQRVAITVGEKTELRHTTGADAVDMESEVIRAACREKGIPSATVRVVSDAANEDLPLDFNAIMDENQEISFPKLALALARSPSSVPRLMQLQKNTRYAAERLAEVLQKLLSRRGG